VGQDREGGEGDGMTGRHRATRRAPEPATEAVGFDVADEARLRAEIGEDGRHERFLVRAALVGAILVAMVITTRVIWL
jgi:hypothetical protein